MERTHQAQSPLGLSLQTVEVPWIQFLAGVCVDILSGNRNRCHAVTSSRVPQFMAVFLARLGGWEGLAALPRFSRSSRLSGVERQLAQLIRCMVVDIHIVTSSTPFKNNSNNSNNNSRECRVQSHNSKKERYALGEQFSPRRERHSAVQCWPWEHGYHGIKDDMVSAWAPAVGHHVDVRWVPRSKEKTKTQQAT